MGYIINPYRYSLLGGPTIPTGLIIPFNDVAANIPSGWSQFTSSGNNAILCTNTLAEIGNTGGSTYVSRTLAYTGNHTGSGTSWWLAPSIGSCIADAGAASRGGHSHSCRVYYYPARRFQILMKATQDHDTFPANTGVLSDLSKSADGLTEITSNGYTLYGTSNSSSSNSSSSKSMSSVNAAGSHGHITGCGPTGSGGNAYSTDYGANGSHSNHSGTPGVTDNMYRFYLSMWTHASQAFDASSGMYALWESLTPPTGWNICDGTNGTDDLTNYMIGLTTTSGSWGTKAGTGQITTSSFGTTSGGSHEHANTYASRSTVATGYHANAVSHSHTVTGASSEYYPPYYKLVILKVAD